MRASRGRRPNLVNRTSLSRTLNESKSKAQLEFSESNFRKYKLHKSKRRNYNVKKENHCRKLENEHDSK